MPLAEVRPDALPPHRPLSPELAEVCVAQRTWKFDPGLGEGKCVWSCDELWGHWTDLRCLPSRKVHKAELFQWAHRDPGVQGLSGDEELPATSSPTYARPALRPHRCLATAAAGNKGCLSGKGEGEGSRPQTRSHPPSPHCGSGSPERGRGGPRLGRGHGLDPFLRSFALIPLQAFRGAGQGLGDSQAVSVGVACLLVLQHPGDRGALQPLAVLGVLPSPSPALPPQTATTVQTRLK